MRKLTIAAVVAATLGATLLPGINVPAAVGTNTQALREAVTVSGIMQHQRRFQAIADANGDTRASGTPGYDASANYVARRLRDAGWEVTRQTFDYLFFEELATAQLNRVSPSPETYTPQTDFLTMDYSGSGDVTANLTATNDVVIPPGTAPSTSNSGCEDSDFPAGTAGTIVLIQRGTCTFFEKALNAQEAGAVGVIIFNEGQPGRDETLAGTLGATEEITIPVTGTSFAIGEELYTLLQGDPVRMHMFVSTLIEPRTSSNVIAEWPFGRRDRVVMAGAHLDSVTEGPGINDNGSGSSVLLEIAEEISDLGIKPRNRIRLAFWGAEEAGLVGSTYYVSQLSARQLKNISVYLNFDMIGSPNFVRFVYDGSGDIGPSGPNGSTRIEEVFLKYFRERRLATEPTAFDGRSDYEPFIFAGIPAGGLFTGAEGIKTPEEAEIYGGTAGVAYDPCYHAACDDIDNLSRTALNQMSDAVAHAILTFAMTTSSVNGTDRASDKAVANGADRAFQSQGHHLKR